VTPRCKHRNGYLSEIVESIICFDVIDGIVMEMGDVAPGGILSYLFHCNDCGREWKWKAIPRPLWLRKIAGQL